jgi:large subunit ribosomal protein L4
MKVNVLDTKGNILEELNLSDKVFGVEPNKEILKQYIRVYLANQRQGTSSTKTKAEVSGGGKKPWAQKGTGRARQGSIRSPQWRHGGVAHGPKPKDWGLTLPKKINKLAILTALSDKFLNKGALILDKVSMKKPSTKEFEGMLDTLKVEGNILYVFEKKNENLVKSAKNLQGVNTVFSGILNAYDLVRAKNVIFEKDALLSLEKKYEAK